MWSALKKLLSNNKEAFLLLVRLGIGHTSGVLPGHVEWDAIETLAAQQGLSAIVLEGIEKLPDNQRPPQVLLLEWIGEMLQNESVYAVQQKAATKMASLFHDNYIRTYILKGTIVSECYPNPEQRLSADVDCFLLPSQGEFDAWALGNALIKARGFEVGTGFYKNSSFHLPEVLVENHQFMVPFRGNKTLKNLELLLQDLMRNDKGDDGFEGTWLYRPPVMVSALFLVEHAYSHFLHEGLTWRMVLDWVMFSRKHKKEIDWYALDALIDEYHFRKFYDSFVRLGKYLIGELDERDLTKVDKKMLADVWAPLDLHENLHGVKGKLALAGNTWRARWKYHYFSEISWIKALWIQAYGVLFDKNPKLN